MLQYISFYTQIYALLPYYSCLFSELFLCNYCSYDLSLIGVYLIFNESNGVNLSFKNITPLKRMISLFEGYTVS